MIGQFYYRIIMKAKLLKKLRAKAQRRYYVIDDTIRKCFIVRSPYWWRYFEYSYAKQWSMDSAIHECNRLRREYMQGYVDRKRYKEKVKRIY